jgi:hypothetical protein
VRAFIADVNLERRDLKKGQKAMLYATLFPDPGKRGRGNKEKYLETKEFSPTRLSQARAVLAHSSALAQDVLHDRIPLDKALEQVKAERNARSQSLGSLALVTGEMPRSARRI